MTGNERTSSLTVRQASARDARAVRAIDTACFPAGDRDREPAPPGELEEAVEVGDVRILEYDGRPVAYVHADTQRPDRIYISGLGVLPEFQRTGLGSRLIDECLATIDVRTWAQVPIVTITSPRNLVMLRVIHARGFRARQVLPDYFGPGRDRLGCQLSVTGWQAPVDQVETRPAGSADAVWAMIESGRYVLQAIQPGDRGALSYVLGPARETDFPPTPASIWRDNEN